ncbi:MAG TPA: FapA family protein [Clostridia bacterium]|nr:FapA family protein [Clostridia bacterium]
MTKQEKILVEGKTVEEAVAKAQQQLGCTRDALEIEVIRQPKRGFLGLGESPAVIQVSVKATSEETGENSAASGEVSPDGTVQIVNGQVIVQDPVGDGLAPVIAPGPNVQIIVNGEIIEKPTEVSSGDDIVVLAEQVEPEWEPELRVSEDDLQAFLTIHRTKGKVYEIQDSPPRRELMVKARLVEDLDPVITLAELKNLLSSRNIVSGIHEENLLRLVNDEQAGELLVAEGERPMPSRDAYVKAVYLEEEEEPAEEEEEKFVQRVARHAVASVEAGQLIAEVVPPVEGKSGLDIYGRILKPKPPKEITLVAGNGVEVDESGRRAYALISGRPEIRGARVTVHPSYVLTGDVDAKVGKVVFKGDVQVMGSLQDEMSIEATGQVIINGYAANATIVAGGNVIVHKNIVGCTVRAGGLSTVAGKVMNVISDLKDELPKLLVAAGQLLMHPSFAQNRDVARVGEGIILKMLLGKKFAHLPQRLEEGRADLEQLVKNIEYAEVRIFAEEYEELCQKLSGSGPLGIKRLQMADTMFASFLEKAEQAMVLLEDIAAAKADLVTGYVQNSHLECSGDVRITGKGSYSANIFAGGDVIIQGSPGTFRGGEIAAGGNVIVRELGSPAEVVTEVRIKPGKRVKADRVFPGVVIYAGTRVERITHEQKMFSLVGKQ